MDCEEKIKTKNLIYDGRILQLYNDEITLPNGKEAKREYVNHSGGSGILAVDKDELCYFVEQFRYPYGKMLLEIPAGKLNQGEDRKLCAIRELKEEVGMTSTCIVDLGVIYPTPAYTNEPLSIFLATELTKGDNNLDDGEFLNVVVLPFEKALEMVMNNEIFDSKTIIAILKYAQIRMKTKI